MYVMYVCMCVCVTIISLHNCDHIYFINFYNYCFVIVKYFLVDCDFYFIFKFSETRDCIKFGVSQTVALDIIWGGGWVLLIDLLFSKIKL